MAIKRSASAVWKGGLKDGKGTVSSDSGALSAVPYNFSQRFENEKGTNPEELIAAAHAACFSMALSLFLGDAGMTAESIDTKATVTLDQGGRRPRRIPLESVGGATVDPRLDMFRDFVNSLDVDPGAGGDSGGRQH